MGLSSKKQTLDDAYAAPANFLEIDVINPITHGIGGKRYTDYEVRMKTNLPVFRVKESSVRRRYSDFEWLRNELERDSKIVVPPLPSQAIKRQMPFRSDDGIYEESFIEERRAGLESFVNKIAGHPLAQNERCLHMFIQEPNIDRNYVPGKISCGKGELKSRVPNSVEEKLSKIPSFVSPKHFFLSFQDYILCVLRDMEYI